MAMSKDDLDFSRMLSVLEREEFFNKTESSEKRRELDEQSSELFELILRKGRIDKRRVELLSSPAEDDELRMKKLEEWIFLRDLEQKNEVISNKWDNILQRWESLVQKFQETVGTPEEPVTYADIVRHHNTLQKVALPMLNAYRKMCRENQPSVDGRHRRKSSNTI